MLIQRVFMRASLWLCTSIMLLLPLGAASEVRLPDIFTGAFAAPLVNEQHPKDQHPIKGWIVARENSTLVWLDHNHQPVATLEENAELLDILQGTDHLWYALTLVGDKRVPTLLLLDAKSRTIQTLAATVTPNFLVENLCLQRNVHGNIYAFLLDARGSAAHWWLMDKNGSPVARKVRQLSVPPESAACRADRHSNLFVSEEGIGVWRYPADAEARPGRTPVDLVPPFGTLSDGTDAMDVVGQSLVAVDVKHKQARLYTPDGNGWRVWPLPDPSGTLAQMEEPERLRAWHTGDQLHLVVMDDGDGQYHQFSLAVPDNLDRRLLLAQPRKQPVVQIQAKVQTEAVSRFGDAADDPAIWVHPTQPELSRVMGTDKKQGLVVYDLHGSRLQLLQVGRVNNVDLRYGFNWSGELGDIAVATQRDTNTLSVFHIAPGTGAVKHKAELPTGLNEIYGICLYRDTKGTTYAIANGKSGRFEQHRLHTDSGEIASTLVRTFHVNSQPEGCVADDERGVLFIGEEDWGVWTLAADPEAPGDLQPVMKAGDVLVEDVEGIALYPASNSRYLIVSSQGDNSYIVLDAQAPYRLRGKFQIAADPSTGIDGVSETDGLDVTHKPLGPAFPHGMMVVQDGHNVMPEAPQNFKYLSWGDVAHALQLND